MSCKGICQTLVTMGKSSKMMYRKGFRYCSRCGLGIKQSEVNCKCCNGMTRGGPLRHKNRNVRFID